MESELRKMEERRLAELRAMDKEMQNKLEAEQELRIAELREMQGKLAAERELRTSAVTFARSEAVKDFLLLGGKDFYAHTLKKVLEDRDKKME